MRIILTNLFLIFPLFNIYANGLNELVDTNMPKKVRTRLVKTLEQISKIRFEDTTHLFDEIFPLNSDGMIDNQWISDRLQILIADSMYLKSDAVNGEGMQIRWGLYPSFYKNGPKKSKIKVGPLFFTGDELQQLATMVHELRHSDGCLHFKMPKDHILNDDLPKPTKEICNDNEKQCERTFNASFGTQMIFLVNYAKNCIDCSETEKFIILTRAYSLFEYILFEEDRIKLKEDLFSEEELSRLRAVNNFRIHSNLKVRTSISANSETASSLLLF